MQVTLEETSAHPSAESCLLQQYLLKCWLQSSGHCSYEHLQLLSKLAIMGEPLLQW